MKCYDYRPVSLVRPDRLFACFFIVILFLWSTEGNALDFSDYPKEWPKITLKENVCKPFSGLFVSMGQGVIWGEPRAGSIDVLLGTLLGRC